MEDKIIIEEAGKMIAEFCGFKYYPYNKDIKRTHSCGWIRGSELSADLINRPGDYLCRKTEDMKYHLSWEWLHSAWSKCYQSLADTNCTSAWAFVEKMRDALCWSDSNMAFEILVKAIQWYNNQKQ